MKYYYAVVNGKNMKYCRYMDLLELNDPTINPYEESTYVGHAFFCESVREARQRIEERYKGIVDEPRIVRFRYYIADGKYEIPELELLP